MARRLRKSLGRRHGVTRLAPGDFVRHPQEPDWGLGQVQSVIGSRATVNFENAGKLLIDLSKVELELVLGDE
jgi:Protein of unknown function (DUF3553)